MRASSLRSALALVACLACLADPKGASSTPPDACEQLHELVYVDWDTRIWTSLRDVRALAPACRSDEWWGYYRHTRGQFESFVGNHALALADFDQRMPTVQAVREADELDLDAFEVRDAVGYVVQEAEAHQVVMVNERHHVSADRLLTLALLEPLAKQGFRYLALEALSHEDPINDRGYPVGATGYYTNDVVFAELLRSALSLGYEVIAYEEMPSQEIDDPEADHRVRRNNREAWQARNVVSRTFDKDRDAKVLVHCGYAHLQERKRTWFTPMAYLLRQLTGIDPLTVDQTMLSERSERRFEHPIRTDAMQRGLLAGERPIVLVDGDGRSLRAGRLADVNVLPASTKHKDGRPLWMSMWGRRRSVRMDVPECASKTCILEAKPADRPDEVPYDRFEVNQASSAVLYLPVGVPMMVESFGLDGATLGRRTVSLDVASAAERPSD